MKAEIRTSMKDVGYPSLGNTNFMTAREEQLYKENDLLKWKVAAREADMENLKRQLQEKNDWIASHM